MRRLNYLLTVIAVSGLTIAAQEINVRPVTPQDLVKGSKDPTAWLTAAGDYNGQRHSHSSSDATVSFKAN